jgi:hypothetical protein
MAHFLAFLSDFFHLTALFYESEYSHQHAVPSGGTQCAGTEYIHAVNTDDAYGVFMVMPNT